MRRLFEPYDDMTTSGRWHIGEVRTIDGSEPLLDAGQRFHGATPLLAEVTTPGLVLDFSLTSVGVPLVSGALARKCDPRALHLHESRKSHFGKHRIHSTENITRLDAKLHRKLTGFYNSVQKDITGTNLRIWQWLALQSYEAQRAFGLLAIRNVENGTWR